MNKAMIGLFAAIMIVSTGCTTWKLPIQTAKTATIPANSSIEFKTADSRGYVFEATIDPSVFNKTDIEDVSAEQKAKLDWKGPFYLVYGADPVLPAGVKLIKVK